MKKYTLILIALFFSSPVLAEDVTVTTYYPSPAGVYKTLEVLNGDESTTLTDFTQGLIKSGLNIVTDFTATAYTPGLFWSTQNNNVTKPKAGIWLQEDTDSTKMIFGTSNNFATGITNTGMVMDQNGNVGIGTAIPQGALDIRSTTTGFIPPRMDTRPSNANSAEGMLIYNNINRQLEIFSNGAWGPVGQESDIVTVKTATTTRTSNTLTNDDDLGISVGAGETWQFEIVAIMQVNGTGDIQWGLSGPDLSGGGWLSATSLMLTAKSGAGAVYSDTYIGFYHTSYTNVGSYNAGKDINGSIYRRELTVRGSVKTGSTAGTFAFKWAPLNSAGGATLYLGSYIKARRVA